MFDAQTNMLVDLEFETRLLLFELICEIEVPGGRIRVHVHHSACEEITTEHHRISLERFGHRLSFAVVLVHFIVKK